MSKETCPTLASTDDEGSPPVHPIEAEIVVGTPEWNDLTERRAKLIHKKIHEGLSEEEKAEFEELQLRSRAAINRTFSAGLAFLEEKIAAAEQISK